MSNFDTLGWLEEQGPFASLGLKAAVLLSGEAPSAEQFQRLLPQAMRQRLYWLAADGGYSHADLYQVAVSAVVGDMDSVDSLLPSLSDTLQVEKHRSDKDESDRNLALAYLAGKGYRQVVQIGGGGARSDHFLAMIYDYQQQRMELLPCLWLTRCEAIFYLQPGQSLHLHFTADSGSALVSSFPLVEETQLYSQHLKWPLEQLRFSLGRNMGGGLPYSLSNWSTSSMLEIAALGGGALVFCPYAEGLLQDAAKGTWPYAALLRAEFGVAKAAADFR